MSVDGSTITSPYKTEKDDSGNKTKVTNFVQKAAANIVNWMDLLSDVEDDSDDDFDNEETDIKSSSNINQQQQYQQTKLDDTNVKSEASTNNSSEKEEAVVEIKQEVNGFYCLFYFYYIIIRSSQSCLCFCYVQAHCLQLALFRCFVVICCNRLQNAIFSAKNRSSGFRGG